MGRSILFSLAFLMMLAAERAAAQPNAALPPIESVDYDAHGRFRVNGKSFFPILLYGAPTDDATLTELREFGFNVLACRAEQCEGLPARGFYGAIHGSKVQADTANVFLGIGMDSPALNYKKNMLEQTAAYNAKTAAAVPGRPIMNAIGYWEDEPAGVVAGKLPSKAMYDDLVAAIDVSAPYLYPVPYQPIASVGEAVARARQATGGMKPIWPILQLFAWEKDARYPTPAELRCMTFLALAEGASGIGFYTYTPVTGQPKGTTIAAVQPELWQSVKQLNREIAEMGPLLVANRPPSLGIRQFNISPGVKVGWSRHDNRLPAVVINSTPAKQSAQFAGASLDYVAKIILSDGRQVPVKDGIAKLTLEPFEVVILRELKKAD